MKIMWLYRFDEGCKCKSELESGVSDSGTQEIILAIVITIRWITEGVKPQVKMRII